MADITIVPTSFTAPAGARTETRPAGETLIAGQPVYMDTSNNKYMKSDANVVAKASVRGITLNGGALNEDVTIQITGLFTFGSGITKDVIYVLSGNAGGIAPSTDLASAWEIDIIGVGATTVAIELGLFNSGVVKT